VDAGVPAAFGVRTVVCYVVRMNVRTNLMLPEELVNEVDHFAGPRGRSRYVTEALEAKLKRDRLREAIEATAGAWKDHPLFPTDESVVEWVREGRRSAHDPWLDER
jgi:predicted DNA-binding protein